MARVWEQFITERDRKIFGAAGFGQKMGLGERPALVIIDVTYSFCGDRSEPVLESVKRWPMSSGEEAWRAIANIKVLIEAARRKGLPIFYTVPAFRPDGWDAGSWLYKLSRVHEDISATTRASNKQGTHIVAEITPTSRDVIINKLKPSGFHGTPLRSLLQIEKVDSLIVTGGTTSGCVRATVLDAFNENLRIAVVEDGCFDRSESSHAINLMDMNAKYADVVPTSELLPEINALPANLFKLPPGI